MNAHLTRHLTKLAIAVAAILAPAASHADTFKFHVDLDVSSLVGAPDSPFYLDFQLNHGSGGLFNTVTLSSFSFVGGTVDGSAFTSGLTSGSMASSITLNEDASNPFNDIYQGFTVGTTRIQFDVSITQNTPGLTPDGFLVSIYDATSTVATTDLNSTMITVPIGAANTLGDVQTFTSAAPEGATATVSQAAIPEPSSVMALIGGVGCLMTLRRRRAQAAA